MRSSAPPTRTLFLDKVFLKAPPDPLRGVELFNLQLARELAALGIRVVLPAERGWSPVIDSCAGKAGIEVLPVRRIGPSSSTLLTARWTLRSVRADTLLIGNTGNGILPLIATLLRSGRCPRATLIAHREASARFVQTLAGSEVTVVAVNEQIARPFRAARYPQVAVDYGILNADRFGPAEPRRTDDPVRFIVLGALDNAWKGADTAIDAYQRLPADLRHRCELHLCAYRHPPVAPAAGIRIYPWTPADRIPGLLREMDVMICPSRDEEVMRETFSQAMVQGMLSSLPVLAHDLPILTEKLDAGGGLIFRDADALSKQMVRLMYDPALRRMLGEQARRTALDRYVWVTPRFVARYLTVP